MCRRRRARGQLPEIQSAFPVSGDPFAEPKPTFDSAQQFNPSPEGVNFKVTVNGVS